MSRSPVRRWNALLLIAAPAACTDAGPRAATATPTTPPSIAYDLAYAGTSPEQVLDLYLPVPAASPAPLVI